MNPLQKMRLMVGRGLVKLINDSGALQVMQVDGLADETRDGVERVQNFGHTGVPPKGAVHVCVAVMGNRDHLAIVACEHPEHRPKGLAEGEAAVYSAFGSMIKLDKDGNIVVTAKKVIYNVEQIDNNADTTNAPNTTNAGTVAISNQLTTPTMGNVDTHVHDEHDEGTTSTPRSGGAS